MNEISLKQAAETLSGAGRIFVCTHVEPDGDALGSLLSLGSLLEKMGKRVVLSCQDPVPENLRFLPGSADIQRPEGFFGEDFDLACSIDASDIERTGSAARVYKACKKTLAIDHHASNTRFGLLNYVDSTVASSGNLVCRLFGEMGAAYDKEDALLLYASLSTDTGNFSFGQMDEEFFLQMAALMRAGLDISPAARRLHLIRSPLHVKLLGRALSSLRFYRGGRLTGMRLTRKDYKETGASPEHTEGIVNRGLNVSGVEMCYLASEEEDGVKFNLRAIPPHDVSKIAVEFGGGGHLLASGFTSRKPLHEAVRALRKRMEAELDRK